MGNVPICNSGMQESPFRKNMSMAINNIPTLMLSLDPPKPKN